MEVPQPHLRASLSMEFQTAIEDPDSEVYGGDGGVAPRFGVCSYFVFSFIIVAMFSSVSVGVWSEMGCGLQCHAALRNGQAYAGACVTFGLIVLVLLYLLDFFCPPHLPGQYCVLWKDDVYAGRALLATALASFLAFSLIIGEEHPTVPIIVSMFFSPVCVLLLRWFLKPRDVFVYHANASPNGESSDSDTLGFEQNMHALRRITGGQKDQKNFFSAVGYAFALAGVLCSAVFVAWASQEGTDFGRAVGRERELLFIRWAAPLGVAAANFMFALLMWLRVILHRTYAGADEVRSRLVIEAASRRIGQDIMRHRMRAVANAYGPSQDAAGDTRSELRGRIEEYLEQQCVSMQRLTNIIKVLNATMLVILGVLFVTFQFTATESQFAAFAQYFIGALALIYGISTAVAFNRLWWKLHAWLQDLPLWRSVMGVARKNWARSVAVILLAPFAPAVLVLSALNQLVRRARGLSPAGSGFFTARVRGAAAAAASWDWVPVVLWCYFWGMALIVYKATPLLLNVLLAWMSSAMHDCNFLLILGSTFAAGFFLFMLPPVPGPPIYLFGGFVISERCPWGFWWGTVVCIAMCFMLKLTACAVQQAIIGGLMSNSLMVRQTCGVHRPLMRAIERVLRKPGMSFGKVMILCGGPDWPTSVLAGILRLSLFQCILGTCPIIVSVITLVLTGSFYLKGAEGEIWMRLGNFMFIATGLLNMLFWAGLAWAIQDEYEKNQQEITAPREEFVELEWADYRAARIAERCAVAWQDVPRLIRAPYALGAVGLGLVGHLFFVKSKSCFGVFALGDNIDSVQWLGEQGLIRPLGVIGCYAAALSFVLLVPYKAWRTRQGRRLAREVKRELAAEEEEWKAAFLRKARRARCNRVGSIEDLSAVHMQAAGLADGDAAGAADEADVAARSKLGAQLDGSGDAAGEEGQQVPMTLTEKAIIIDI